MHLRRVFLALALTLAALAPARATSEHEYAKGEYAIVLDGLAPNGKISIAVHGEGEGGHDQFSAYLMSEPGHAVLATLADISENNNLDTAPDAYHAFWSPDSRYVAVAFRSDRHIVTLNVYAIAGNLAARLIKTPDLFREVAGRAIDPKTEADLDERSAVRSLAWKAPRRFHFSDVRMFMVQDNALATKVAGQLGAFGKSQKQGDRTEIDFAAEADVAIGLGDHLTVINPRPGKFE